MDLVGKSYTLVDQNISRAGGIEASENADHTGVFEDCLVDDRTLDIETCGRYAKSTVVWTRRCGRNL